MSSGERSFYEIQKSVVTALGKKMHTVGFREITLLDVPDLNGQKVHVVLDLAMHRSPIFGMGEDNEHAAADAIRRNGEVYAYVLRFSPYSDKSVKAVRNSLWELDGPRDILDLPTDDSVAVSTKASRFEMQSLLKKVKGIVSVKLV